MKKGIGFKGWASRLFATLLIVNVAVPAGAVVTVGKPLKEEIDVRLELRERRLAREKARRVASRELTEREQGSLRGRVGGHPYLAGQSKWDVVYKGINVMTGAYTATVTDLSFEEGYGIPVNITRSYNSNTKDEGPFGWGWTLSADMRSTAGGLIKSSSGPVRSVPTNFKDRPSLESDPNLPVGSQPVEAVVATDAGGTEETIQKDVDGVLNTPPWDKNEADAQYETITVGNSLYRVLSKNYVRTPEGTVYEYSKQGSYVNGGTRPWDDPGATGEPANVMKIVKATDRHGNETTYEYGSGLVTFQKANGVVQEHPLVAVQMPNGHRIQFVWGTGPGGRDRITEVWNMKGPNNPGKKWKYFYGDDAGFTSEADFLTSVETPGGKETLYTYGLPLATTAQFSGPANTGLLTGIRDHRHLWTYLSYKSSLQKVAPYEGQVPTAVCMRIVQPNGVRVLHTNFLCKELPDEDWPRGGFYYGGQYVWGSRESWAEYADGKPLFRGTLGIFSTNTAYMDGSGPNVPSLRVDIGEVLGGSGSTFGMDDNAVHDKRQYHALSQDALETVHRSYSITRTSLPELRELRADAPIASSTVQQQRTVRNFMGNPLSESVSEGAYGQTPTWRTTEYAYWGADKYYQRKAVRAPYSTPAVYSFTDYYPSTAPAGSRGMTYRVYDPKYVLSFASAKESDPDTWKSSISPGTTSPYAGETVYDAKGRVVDTYKMRTAPAGLNPAVYTRTNTTYGADQSPYWGGARTVIEDYGGIGRTTQTTQFDETGKPEITSNGKGEVFKTSRYPDGETDEITYSYGSVSNKPLVKYEYYTSATDWSVNGLPKSVRDLSLIDSGGLGVESEQVFAYYDSTSAPSAASLGQVASVTDRRKLYAPDGPDAGTDLDVTTEQYGVGYDYNEAGNRARAIYTTPQGVQEWEYADYVTVGGSLNPKQVSQTLRKLQSGAKTAEEFHYDYDFDGRLKRAAFAQTPEDPQSPPSGSDPWYTPTRLPVARAVADYIYDAGGRLTTLAHWWQNRSGTTWTTEAVLKDVCAYETTGLSRGLKTGSKYYVKDAQSPANFAVSESNKDEYTYDVKTGYLDSWKPNGGTTRTYSYDPNGNRQVGSQVPVYDALNRQTGLGSLTYGVDVLGNRTSKSGSTPITYDWDESGRLAHVGGLNNGYGHWYEYRADGLRTSQRRQSGTNSPRVTKWRYDGQSPVEEVYTLGTTVETTRWALGPRGTESQELTTASGTKVSYPLYDAHGNAIAHLERSGNGGYSYPNLRTYDPWGNIMSGPTSGRPVQGYCGSLGHRQDDEIGLVYMRARYYDPQCGRFISQDPKMHGSNWFAYCDNDPVNRIDQNGTFWEEFSKLLTAGINKYALGVFGGIFLGLSEAADEMSEGKFNPARITLKTASGAIEGWVTAQSIVMIKATWLEAAALCRFGGVAAVAATAVATYVTILILLLDTALFMAIDGGINEVAPDN